MSIFRAETELNYWIKLRDLRQSQGVEMTNSEKRELNNAQATLDRVKKNQRDEISDIRDWLLSKMYKAQEWLDVDLLLPHDRADWKDELKDLQTTSRILDRYLRDRKND